VVSHPSYSDSKDLKNLVSGDIDRSDYHGQNSTRLGDYCVTLGRDTLTANVLVFIIDTGLSVTLC